MRFELVAAACVVLACRDSRTPPALAADQQSSGTSADDGAAPAHTPDARTAGPGSTRNPETAGVLPQSASLRLELVTDDLQDPVYLTAPQGDPRLFVVEQAGRIRIIAGGRVLPRPFLDIRSRVRSGGEQGLLSVAFDPHYRRNGHFFVNFTDRRGDTRIERFRVSQDPDVADESSARPVLQIDQPYSNHNGGLLMFGPDGMLYIGMGDGGSGGDPHRHGQRAETLLGDLLRIDVSRAEPYTIPAGNPFIGRSNARPEIWATGLRNPWRFSFDSVTGLLYIADVGQNAQEEISVAPAARAGLNYGWNIMEGSRCYRSDNCNRTGLTLPILTYGRAGGACSVTGGFVYRGRRIPQLVGHYFYSDYCAGFIRSFRYDNGRAVDRREWHVPDIGNVTSFGEDSSREMYILTHGGRVYRFAGIAPRTG